MHATPDTSIILRTVAVVSGVDDHVKRDKLSLSQFKPKELHSYSSGTQAVAELAKIPLDLILCDSDAGDITGCEFITRLRACPLHRKTPVIMVTTTAQKEAVLDAIASGCAGYVLRPYSPETFRRHILMAKQLERFSEIEEEQLLQAKDMLEQGDFDDAIEEFEEILSLQDEAQKYYDMGCDYLLKQKFGKAIISFNKAIKINDLFAEAYQGLAKAYQGKNDMAKYKAYLQRAAEVHAQFDRLEEAKNIFIEILKQDSDAPNPYNTLGVRLRRNGDYPGAIHAYKRALEISPTDENIHYNLSKAFYYMGEMEDARSQITNCLKYNSNFPEAIKFYKELFGREYPRELRKKAPVSTDQPKSIKDV